MLQWELVLCKAWYFRRLKINFWKPSQYSKITNVCSIYFKYHDSQANKQNIIITTEKELIAVSQHLALETVKKVMYSSLILPQTLKNMYIAYIYIKYRLNTYLSPDSISTAMLESWKKFFWNRWINIYIYESLSDQYNFVKTIWTNYK